MLRRLVRRIKPLQDDLGHANDVRSAHALVADLRNGETGAIERADQPPSRRPLPPRQTVLVSAITPSDRAGSRAGRCRGA
jgi:hypothetical protein